MKDINRKLRTFAAALKRDFAEDVTRDPKGFKKQVVKLIRRELPPKPGRPNDPRYDKAARMADQGKNSGEILRSLDAGFDSLDPWTRMLAARGLRAALRRRGRRFRVKDNS